MNPEDRFIHFSKQIDDFIQLRQYKNAVQLIHSALLNALHHLYGRIRSSASPELLTSLQAVENTITQADPSRQQFSLDDIILIFDRANLIDQTGAITGHPSFDAGHFPLKRLRNFINLYLRSNLAPDIDELRELAGYLQEFLMRTGLVAGNTVSPTEPATVAASGKDLLETRTCPSCGEPVENDWRLCPCCESPLKPLACPGCGRMIKEHWKRCPECLTRLVCRFCGARFSRVDTSCAACGRPQSETATVPAQLIEPVTGMEFIHIPGGSYAMGDVFDEGLANEKPVHDIRIGSFYIGRYPVTQGQWKKVMNHNPSQFDKGDTYPVEQVTFTDVNTFITRLSELNGNRYTFSLPSEAQWEFAARSGGKRQKYAGGDSPDELAWYGDNSQGSTHPVGLKKPNGFGLYDMSGNVWEWCRDIFCDDAYRYHDEENPVHTRDSDRKEQVIRGGSWNLDAWSIRCSRRFGYPADFMGPGLGFRMVILNAG